MTGPCDICKAEPAPFGYAPPPAMRIAVRRPLRTCAAPACRAAAEARRQALIDRRDPFSARRQARQEAPERPDLPAPAQGSLL